MTTFKEFLGIVQSDKESNLISVNRARKAIAKMPKPLSAEQLETIEKAKELGMQRASRRDHGRGTVETSVFWDIHHSWRNYKEFMDRKTVAKATGRTVDDFILNPAYWYEGAQEKEKDTTRGRFYHRRFHPDDSTHCNEETEYLIVNEHGEWILASEKERAQEGYKFSIPIDDLLKTLARKDLI